MKNKKSSANPGVPGYSFAASLGLLVLLFLSGCQVTSEPSAPSAKANSAALKANQEFGSQHALDNINFAYEQYLKMANLVEEGDKNNLHYRPACGVTSKLCYPRSLEHEKIYMDRIQKWTNGFYPGVLWKIIDERDALSTADKKALDFLISHTKKYNDGLYVERRRKSTHDLGFILYDSFGEGLDVEGVLTKAERDKYEAALREGRESLASRYSEKYKLIRSWDWDIQAKIAYIPEGESRIARQNLDLTVPWDFPVIVDNMMNLEFLLTSEDKKHHRIAFDHAEQTLKNHYHFLPDDKNKQYPIAYHVIEYSTMRGGNWQGVGHKSAWSRGQGWSFYGFVTMAEFMERPEIRSHIKADEYPDFDAFVHTLYGTLEHHLKDDPVPLWDFVADKAYAADIAKYNGPDTTRFSRIFNLCDFKVPDNILPYTGYSPIVIDPKILSAESLAMVKKYQRSVNGELFLQKEGFAPCGTKAYDLSGRTHIPKDTSAAALYAAGAYRYAQFTKDKALKKKYIAFGDRIMKALTLKYRTDRNKSSRSYQLGFLLDEATGNLPSEGEINTSIVYADFYFLEANIRRLALSNSK